MNVKLIGKFVLLLLIVLSASLTFAQEEVVSLELREPVLDEVAPLDQDEYRIDMPSHMDYALLIVSTGNHALTFHDASSDRIIGFFANPVGQAVFCVKASDGDRYLTVTNSGADELENTMMIGDYQAHCDPDAWWATALPLDTVALSDIDALNAANAASKGSKGSTKNNQFTNAAISNLNISAVTSNLNSVSLNGLGTITGIINGTNGGITPTLPVNPTLPTDPAQRRPAGSLLTLINAIIGRNGIIPALLGGTNHSPLLDIVLNIGENSHLLHINGIVLGENGLLTLDASIGNLVDVHVALGGGSLLDVVATVGTSNSILDANVTVGEAGSLVDAGVTVGGNGSVLDTNVTVGNGNIVTTTATIGGGSVVNANATVGGSSIVTANATVGGGSLVTTNATVGGGSIVTANATVGGSNLVNANATVGGSNLVTANATVGGGSVVNTNVTVGGTSSTQPILDVNATVGGTTQPVLDVNATVGGTTQPVLDVNATVGGTTQPVLDVNATVGSTTQPILDVNATVGGSTEQPAAPVVNVEANVGGVVNAGVSTEAVSVNVGSVSVCVPLLGKPC